MTKKIAVGLAGIFAVIQLGCSAYQPFARSLGSAYVPRHGSRRVGTHVACGAPLPTRDTLVRGEEPFPHYGAYGYLVFTARPSEREKSRYLEVCNGYRLNVEPVGEYADVPPDDLMVTFWLLEESPDGDQAGCEELLAKYDYATAEQIASAVGKLDASGPFLVAWVRPFSSRGARHPPLVFDLSTFSEDDLGRGLRIWYERICRRPEAWKSGWRLAVFREEFRNLLQRYGGKIVEIVG